MKKLLLLILAFLLSFSMVACDVQSILDGLMPSSSSSYDEEEEEEEDEEEEEANCRCTICGSGRCSAAHRPFSFRRAGSNRRSCGRTAIPSTSCWKSFVCRGTPPSRTSNMPCWKTPASYRSCPTRSSLLPPSPS